MASRNLAAEPGGQPEVGSGNSCQPSAGARKAQGTLGPDIPPVARRRPGRVKIRVRVPLPEFHLSEFHLFLR